MFALIQSENHASNKGKTAGRYQFDTHPTGIGLKTGLFVSNLFPCERWIKIKVVSEEKITKSSSKPIKSNKQYKVIITLKLALES